MPPRRIIEPMKRFDLIEHTADIGLTAYGRSLAEAYGNAAYGLFSIITDLRKVRKAESKSIELKEKNPQDLLYTWLNYLIYLFDAEQMLFKQCDIEDIKDSSIKAVCYGEKVDPSRHKIKLGVKAATYHMLEVDPEKKKVQVIFDI
jgi:SHS2 domain-containing protein